MRSSIVLAAPLLLGACSNTITSTRDRQSDGDANPVHTTAPRQAAHHGTLTDVDGSTAELRASCALWMTELGIDAEIAQGAEQAEVSVESHAIGEPDCADFAWVRGFVTGAALIEPAWSGPDRSSAWDCNHSSLEYGVYRRVGADWEYVGGGLAYGNLDGGSCGYSVDNFPTQAGSDSVVVTGDSTTQVAPTEVRVGLRAWTHNDPAFGHSGDDCDQSSCFWPAAVRWEGE